MANNPSPSRALESSSWTCQQCGLDVDLSCAVKVEGNRAGFSTPQLFHQDCFRCYACKRRLTKDCYFLSLERNLYCAVHHDFEFPNGHDRFVKDLTTFRTRSLELVASLAGGGVYGGVSFRNKKRYHENGTTCQTMSLTCSCMNSTLLVDANGFWIECLDHDCPLFHYPTKVENPFSTDNQTQEAVSFLEHYAEEIYESCFYEYQHFNYYCKDQSLGPVLLSIRQEVLCNREYYRILVRSSSLISEGLVPSSCFFVSNKYDRDEVVAILGREMKVSSSFKQAINPSTPKQLCQLDRVLLKNNFKVGVVYVENNQVTEEEFFKNNHHSEQFDEFLAFLGDKVSLKGFTKYNGGLDTTFSLTGDISVYTEWKNNQVMFHVSTLLPLDSKDEQTLQRKRHIGNDIVCIVFLASSDAQFSPSSITSNFIHVFIVVRPVMDQSQNQMFEIGLVCRDHVQPFQPPLWSSTFSLLDTQFRDWLLSKIINGERASYRSPKFAAMQERSRRQLMTELIANEHSVDPAEKKNKHSPTSTMAFNNEALSLDWNHETFEDLKGLKKDFHEAFNLDLDEYHDVCFLVGSNEQHSIPGVKAILASRSRVFSALINGNAVCKAQPSAYAPFKQMQPHVAAVKAKKPPRQPPKLKKRISLDRILRRTEKDVELPREDKTVMFGLDRQEICIPQFEVRELMLLMEYLHTGSCVLYAEVLPALLATAEYFEIADLMQLCLEAATDLLSPEKACPMLVAVRAFTAKYRMADKLQRIVMEYIRSNITIVYRQFDMASLPEDCVILVLSLDVKVDEMLKFRLVCEWIDRNTFSGSPGVAEVLKDALVSFIKLSNFTMQDLQQHIQPSGLFSAKTIEDALRRRQSTKKPL